MNELEPRDVLVHDLDDDEGLRTHPDMHFEATMHTETYKVRSDINAVIHSHPPYATALGATDASLEFLAHDAVMFAEHGVGKFDEHGLITDPSGGREMALALGDSRALLLRGHGVLVVGEDIRWAVRAALTLERAIKIQMIAHSLGQLMPLTDEQAKELFPRKYTAKKYLPEHDARNPDDKTSLDEFWEFWERNVRKLDSQPSRQVSL